MQVFYQKYDLFLVFLHIMKIIMIGAGNLATSLAVALTDAGHDILHEGRDGGHDEQKKGDVAQRRDDRVGIVGAISGGGEEKAGEEDGDEAIGTNHHERPGQGRNRPFDLLQEGGDRREEGEKQHGAGHDENRADQYPGLVRAIIIGDLRRRQGRGERGEHLRERPYADEHQCSGDGTHIGA